MHVTALFAGRPTAFGPRGAKSSIIKQPVESITVLQERTLEDEQANRKLHGGPEKVLHQFSLAAYGLLQSHFPEGLFGPGTIGENLTVDTMDDSNVQVGDVYQFGDVILQVSAPRAPCNKISLRFDIKNLDRFVGARGITGWYYRVLEPGVIRVDDPVAILSRPEESICIGDLMRAVYDDSPCGQLDYYSQLPTLDDEWRHKCLHKLEKQRRSKDA
ncbi:MOSC domain-containing protein [Alteromonas aestuariivivens]|uniref:MOSC domain-containing protein n=1 Tax=Alteromonas aestuariivivens TaxID=1938339 RepID=A0A3D8M7H2_9ALTE|nr:MOSC domain-containing protein [Alteromonas aestuariivivens]RDV25610.1 MOSC domain-containing protein [Alteromonas aestuariivivens]